MKKNKKMEKYEVSLPVAYFEVFHVFATSKTDAIKRVRDNEGDQNCTDANRRWSRRAWAKKLSGDSDPTY